MMDHLVRSWMAKIGLLTCTVRYGNYSETVKITFNKDETYRMDTSIFPSSLILSTNPCMTSPIKRFL